MNTKTFAAITFSALFFCLASNSFGMKKKEEKDWIERSRERCGLIAIGAGSFVGSISGMILTVKGLNENANCQNKICPENPLDYIKNENPINDMNGFLDDLGCQAECTTWWTVAKVFGGLGLTAASTIAGPCLQKKWEVAQKKKRKPKKS